MKLFGLLMVALFALVYATAHIFFPALAAGILYFIFGA